MSSAVLSSFVCLFLSLGLIKILQKLWWTPTRIQRRMSLQGITGPPYRIFYGSTQQIRQMKMDAMRKPMELSHDIGARVYPHLHSWLRVYGRNFLYWHGTEATLVITETELVKEVLFNRDDAYPKVQLKDVANKLFGNGLFAAEGETWARSRKLANHMFHGETLKGVIPTMVGCVETMLEKWKLSEGKELEVFQEFKVLTSDVISQTAFGSSYEEGKIIFENLNKLSSMILKSIDKIRFFRKVYRSKEEVESEKLRKSIHDSIMKIVEKREEKVDDYGSDFLGALLRANHDSNEKQRIPVDDMIDECKTFYFAGHETTVLLLSWTIFLLALHSDWQEEARKEVLSVLGQSIPTFDIISKLKTMNMIINESLRLYPPAMPILRVAEKETKLGNLEIPKNTRIAIPTLEIHHRPNLWGEDVNLFKPERFADGVAGATQKNSAAFLPFGLGPRICVGMNFATAEAKIALSMILQRYFFSLSPAYVHAPAAHFAVRPQNGIQIIFRSI